PARRGDETGRRLLEAQGVIDTGKVDRVLDAPQQHRLLVVRPAGRAPPRQADTVSITPRVVGVKDDFGAPHRRPAHRLGVAPALVANHYPELHPVDLEESPGIAVYVERILARGQLVLGLVSLNVAAGVEDHGDV